jgi:Uma2 family endonuclease
MADNTLQFEWIVTIKGGLEYLFRNDPDVFVAGDLLWYAVEGNNSIRLAPDAMVVFGRPKGYRGSYRQWEEAGIAPQVVFEVLSPGNTTNEMTNKRQWYARYGVEEYYEYDPGHGTLRGWQMEGTTPVEIERMQGWVSPRLGVWFGLEGMDLVLIGPDGKRFQSYLEVTGELDELAVKQAMTAVERDLERDGRKAAEEMAARLAARLRELGIDPLS